MNVRDVSTIYSVPVVLKGIKSLGYAVGDGTGEIFFSRG